MIERQHKRSSRRAILIIIAVCALAGVGTLGLIARAQHPSVVAATVAQTERVTVAIEGMHCGNCASGIKAMLKRTAGVVSADVSYERKEAVVEYDPSRTTREKIVEAINNMGYKASVKG
jgi:copper chaperone CopZ